jgi:hypothetical protein
MQPTYIMNISFAYIVCFQNQVLGLYHSIMTKFQIWIGNLTNSLEESSLDDFIWLLVKSVYDQVDS